MYGSGVAIGMGLTRPSRKWIQGVQIQARPVFFGEDRRLAAFQENVLFPSGIAVVIRFSGMKETGFA